MKEDEQKTAPEPAAPDWLRAAADFWEIMAKMAQVGTPSAEALSAAGPQSLEWGQSALGKWSSLAFVQQKAPAPPKSFLQGMETLSEVSLKMAQLGWEGYFRLQQQWLEQLDKLGQDLETAKSEAFSRDALKAWTEICGKNIRQLLSLPQLGLTRVYQERVTRATAAFSLFQEAMAEFIRILSLPVETSLEAMKARLEELSREGNLSDDLKDYYDMWIKILEGHYMTLLKSPGYLDSLGNILAAASSYTVARKEALDDLLKTLQIPTYEDFDELAKDVYRLKKKVFAEPDTKAQKPKD